MRKSITREKEGCVLHSTGVYCGLDKAEAPFKEPTKNKRRRKEASSLRGENGDRLTGQRGTL